MDTMQPPEEQIRTVQLYLDREFPHQVRETWWDQNTMAQIFEISDGSVLRHIVVDLGFFQQCPDFATELRNSELVDYIRESRAPRRCFRVTWNEKAIHVRSRPL